MELINEIIKKVGVPTLTHINDSINRGYELADTVIKGAPLLNVRSSQNFHQIIYNLGVDYLLETMISSGKVPNLTLKYIPNRNNYFHSEITAGDVVMTLSSCNSGRMAMPRPSIFRTDLAFQSQISFDDFDENQEYRNEPENSNCKYAILCHRYQQHKGGVKPHIYIGVPDKNYSIWADSCSMDRIVQPLTIINDESTDLDQLDIAIREEFLNKLRDMEG